MLIPANISLFGFDHLDKFKKELQYCLVTIARNYFVADFDLKSINMKYSKNFERDFNWYIKMRHKFNFDGQLNYFNKQGKNLVVHDKNGKSAKECFYIYDSQGKIIPTKHPNLLKCLLKVKGSVNLHIKMYAEDRASGLLSLLEFRGLCIIWKAPEWFYYAVERSKNSLYQLNENLPNWFKEQSLLQLERYDKGLKH